MHLPNAYGETHFNIYLNNPNVGKQFVIFARDVFTGERIWFKRVLVHHHVIGDENRQAIYKYKYYSTEDNFFLYMLEN